MEGHPTNAGATRSASRGSQRGLPPGTGPVLSLAEAQRVQHYQDRLEQALQARDRAALRRAKQDVLQAAYLRQQQPATPALRTALRRLSWWMAGMRLSRDPLG